MTFTPAIVLITLAASSSVHAQQVNPADALNQATQMLAAMPNAPRAGADQIAALRQDFTDFAAAYLAGPTTPATGTAGAVGTSGRTDAAGDWRTRYQRVEADLAALLGPVGSGASAAPTVSLDPDTRARLETVRSRLQMFYAATMSQPDGNPIAHTGTPPPSSNGAPAAPRPPVSPTGEAPQTTPAQSPAPTGGSASPSGAAPSSGAAGTAGAAPSTGNRSPQVDSEWGTALAMLDRMERILNEATKEPGKINIDRASIDEMRAEIAHVRTMLRAGIKN
jgi:type II secretory pathway pseudopilin PulG